MRNDAFGFMWQDTPAVKVPGEKVKVERGPRPMPPIPDNGWRAPAPHDFPRLEKAEFIALDTETRDPELMEKGPGVRRDGCHIVGISVAVPDGQSWYFPIRHEVGAEQNLPVENVMAWAQDNLTRPNQMKVGTNLLYDLDYLAEEGVNVAGPFYDVQVAEALLDENARGYDLESISWRRIGKGKTTAELEDWAIRAYGDKNYKKNIYRCPPQLVGPYAQGDAINPIEIMRVQIPLLRAEGLTELFAIESGLTEPLLAMRRRGVRVNLKRAQQIDDQLTQSIADESAKLKALCGFDVNVNSKEHLVRIFEANGLPYPRTPPSKSFPNGQPSFVKEFLEHHEHPIAKLITSRRGWEKFRDTFVRGYVFNSHIRGRIHCLFNQTKTDEYGTVSGRFSSSLPNLQNIPARDPFWGPLIRSMFMPDIGHGWSKLDWSQIEYRFLVHIANRVLNGKFGSAEAVKKYRSDPNTDYHNYVSDITSVERKHAKNINFGLVYGMGEPELARQLGIDIDEATPIFQQYHTALPFVKEIRQRKAYEASEKGYITTILGRRRRFDLWEPRFSDFSDDNERKALPMSAAMSKWGNRIRRAYTHKALNGEIQGSAADLMKLAMKLYWERKDLVAELGPWLLTVHDEGDISTPKTKAAKEAVLETKRLMESCMKLSIPIIAELSTGPNWGSTK